MKRVVCSVKISWSWTISNSYRNTVGLYLKHTNASSWPQVDIPDETTTFQELGVKELSFFVTTKSELLTLISGKFIIWLII